MERDGPYCGRCQRYVDTELPGTDPRGPSIGHRYPVALGGTDHMTNLRLEHLRCNQSAGARIDALPLEPSAIASIAAPIEVDPVFSDVDAGKQQLPGSCNGAPRRLFARGRK
ncbi:MAG TPA: hypothetical protein VGQ02_10770 [Candidatus Limnocylindrales bacterium]|jgi:hypothetical protein|nr:hypothetical protein [Candidatus Limnocylindrales bacterium]